MQQLHLIGPFAQLLTMNHLPAKGAIADNQLEIIEEAGILIKGNIIEAVDNYHHLYSIHKNNIVYHTTLTSHYTVLPGFIDAHTHICFAGSRANDFAMRNAGKSYLEIQQSGGGIWDTVTQTRAADINTLIENITIRANRLLKMGITTIEVKSGYGLSVAEELKILSAIKEANNRTAADLVPTCLAAHIIPKDFNGSATDYLAHITQDLLPVLLNENLTKRIDIFIEKGAFSPDDAKQFLHNAKAMGFDITVHADQFSCGGSKVAVETGALSADHLEACNHEAILALAQSNTTAIALPGASLGLGCSFAPARQLLDAGAALAIASDWNPGSAPMGNLLMQASVLGSFEKLTNTEVLAGITTRAAKALSLNDRGILKKGNMADFSIYKCANYQEITYQQGMLLPDLVFKNGKQIN